MTMLPLAGSPGYAGGRPRSSSPSTWQALKGYSLGLNGIPMKASWRSKTIVLIWWCSWPALSLSAASSARSLPWLNTVGSTCLSGVRTASFTRFALRSRITLCFHPPPSLRLEIVPKGAVDTGPPTKDSAASWSRNK